MLSKLCYPVSRSSVAYVCFACRTKCPSFPLPLRNLTTDASSASPSTDLPHLAYNNTSSSTCPSSQATDRGDGEPSTKAKPRNKRLSEKTVETELPLQAKQTPPGTRALRSQGRKRKTRGLAESSLSKLNSICRNLKLDKASYAITELRNANKETQYQSKVTVHGRTFSDETLYPRKQAAKEAVASKALEYVESLSTAEYEQPKKRNWTIRKVVAQTVKDTLYGANTNSMPVAGAASAGESIVTKVSSWNTRGTEQDEIALGHRARVAAAVKRYLDAKPRGTAREGFVSLKRKQSGLEAQSRPIRKVRTLAVSRRPGLLTVRANKESTEIAEHGHFADGQLSLKEALTGRRRPQTRLTSSTCARPKEDGDMEQVVGTAKSRRNNHKPLGFRPEKRAQSLAISELVARSKSNSAFRYRVMLTLTSSIERSTSTCA
jgi:hypothetical protein